MAQVELASDIAEIRSFNRFYTRRIGVLDEAHLGSGFTLGEGRVLYELAQTDGLTAKRLAEMLGLDGGYLSRILRRFEGAGLLDRRPDPRDGRSSKLHLTSQGREAFGRLNARSDAQAAGMMEALDEAARQRLTGALQAVRNLLERRADEVVLRPNRPGDMGWLIQRHAELYAAEQGWGPLFEAMVGEVCTAFIRNFDPQMERCWIAERAGERVGCVFLAKGEPGVAKLRMLLVEPSARGVGLGRRLVDECIAFARAKGYREMTLWTQSVLSTARQLYARAGFQLVHSEAHDLIGQPLIGETWRLRL